MTFSRFIDPTTDFGFKRLFGREESKPVLTAFLEAILELPHPIVELTYAPPQQYGEQAIERSGIYDIYCVDNTGQRFIVEMQRGYQTFFKDRSLYYATFPIAEQLKRGETSNPYRLVPIYLIAVLNFNIDPEPGHRRRVQLCDVATGKVFYEKLTFVYIELPKFSATLAPTLPDADQWIYLLRHLPALEDIPPELNRRPFTDAFRFAEEAALSPTERERYERDRKETLDELSRVQSARQEGLREGLDKGLREGLDKGLREGLDKGLREGLDKGLREGLDKGETTATERIARQMLTAGLERATIRQMTGLSDDDLERLATQQRRTTP